MPSDALPDDPETLKAMLLAERVQNERLRQIIKELQRHRFGRRAETLPEDQMLLGLEDVEQAAAHLAAETDGASALERPGLTSAGSTEERCQRICRGLRSSSTLTTGPARAARVSCT
jgi:transposase